MKTVARLRSLLLSLILIPVLVNEFSAQPVNEQQTRALTSWISVDAPPGWEHLATDRVMKTMQGWKRDAIGNLVLRKGTGTPRRVVACAVDRPGFAVTEITDTGYLRIREVGSLRQHPLWTQFHEGQRIRVLTRRGSVPGVVIVKSTHLQRGRTPNAPVTTLDDLWVDVGATSKADVRRLGIQLLDPLVRDLPEWTFADYVTGPQAAARVGCGVLAQVARGEVSRGETFFVIASLRSFGEDGLEAALRQIGRVDEITILDRAAEASTTDNNPVLRRRVEKPAFLPDSTGVTSVQMLSPKARFAGSLVESVRIEHATALRNEVERAAGISSGTNSSDWLALPQANGATPILDVHSSTAKLLKTLADSPGVSGHETEVRAAILAALPAWARQRATTDTAGNLIVEVGPDRDPVMFIAHMDEVGFEISSIADDGTVALRNRGGLFPSLWEGQPALLHFDRAANEGGPHRTLRGVFVPRETATGKQPDAVTAWFGVDGEELKRLGVGVGQSVTAYKSATRLGATRFTGRAMDDRAGSTALILAAARLNPATLDHKVILSWSVREETGLEGAMAMAKRYGASTKRVFSIDTFVSSDSPVETTRFAFAPLGQGAVVRGLDNSSVVTPADLDLIVDIARVQSIPLQVGATNGGTDGSDFVRYGVSHVGLSWPGRYSHSPVEVLDLRDLESLVRIIHALAVAGK